MASKPHIQTTTVGSYPVPDWLSALPSEQARLDATRVVFDIQRQAGIDLPTDGELYRFDVNHPDTNGMIEYFLQAMAGIRTSIGRTELEAYSKKSSMKYRRRPAGVVEAPIAEGSLNLLADCQVAAGVAQGPFKFTVTSPYMLARTLLDGFYRDFESLTQAIADVLSQQVTGLPCSCVQIDEANLPGNVADWQIASHAINTVLDRVQGEKAVHLCFGNYGGQSIQAGEWKSLVRFLNSLRVGHLVLELAHRPQGDLDALKGVDAHIKVGVGVIDVKVNHIETADEVARRIEKAVATLGAGRVGWVHPDCGFWMLKRSIADRKMEALVKGRNKYLSI